MLTDEQIRLVAAETLVPRAAIDSAMLALERSGGNFTAADVVALVVGMQFANPPAPSWRFWPRARMQPPPS